MYRPPPHTPTYTRRHANTHTHTHTHRHTHFISLSINYVVWWGWGFDRVAASAHVASKKHQQHASCELTPPTPDKPRHHLTVPTLYLFPSSSPPPPPVQPQAYLPYSLLMSAGTDRHTTSFPLIAPLHHISLSPYSHHHLLAVTTARIRAGHARRTVQGVWQGLSRRSDSYEVWRGSVSCGLLPLCFV